MKEVKILIPELEIGGAKVMDPDNWVEEVEDIMNTYELNENIVMAVIWTKLKGFAENWCKANIKGKTSRAEFKGLLK